MKRNLYNYAAFQLGWFACVLGAAWGLPGLGPVIVAALLAVHLLMSRQPRLELKLVIITAALGLLLDSALLATGWVAYPTGTWLPGLAPYWMVALWVVFATSLNLSMRWLGRSTALAALTGLLGGPLSYLAGEKLGAIELIQPTPALLALGIGWAIVLPALARLASRLDGFAPDSPPSYLLPDWSSALPGATTAPARAPASSGSRQASRQSSPARTSAR